jgi:hypothetical protein
LLPTLTGDVNFWLDGHYSAGVTFQGDSDTPITQELATIATCLPGFRRVSVLVDDLRCFDPTLPDLADYPSRSFLVDWANGLGLAWHIEHDIFIARTPGT